MNNVLKRAQMILKVEVEVMVEVMEVGIMGEERMEVGIMEVETITNVIVIAKLSLALAVKSKRIFQNVISLETSKSSLSP